MGAIVGRLASGSERATWGWLAGAAAWASCWTDFQTLSLMQMRASDLMKHRQAIGPTCSPGPWAFDLADRHPVRSDPTRRGGPPSTQGAAGALEGEAQRLSAATLGLVLDGAGFVRRSQVFAGRVDEPRTLAGMLGALEAPPTAQPLPEIPGRVRWASARSGRGISIALQPAFERLTRLRGVSRPLKGHREGPGTDRAAEGGVLNTTPSPGAQLLDSPLPDSPPNPPALFLCGSLVWAD